LTLLSPGESPRGFREAGRSRRWKLWMFISWTGHPVLHTGPWLALYFGLVAKWRHRGVADSCLEPEQVAGLGV
jgi:hypothetical protein